MPWCYSGTTSIDISSRYMALCIRTVWVLNTSTLFTYVGVLLNFSSFHHQLMKSSVRVFRYCTMRMFDARLRHLLFPSNWWINGDAISVNDGRTNTALQREKSSWGYSVRSGDVHRCSQEKDLQLGPTILWTTFFTEYRKQYFTQSSSFHFISSFHSCINSTDQYLLLKTVLDSIVNIPTITNLIHLFCYSWLWLLILACLTPD